MSKIALSAGIDKSPVGGPKAHHDPHRFATDWAGDDGRLRVDDRNRRRGTGVCLQDHGAEGIGRDGTAGMHKAEVADFHETIGQDMLEEPAEKLHGIEARGAWACTAGFTIGEGNGTLLEGDDPAVGDGDSEDIGSEVLEGCGPVWVGLAMNVPVGFPNLWIDPCEQSSLAHVVFEESAVDG